MFLVFVCFAVSTLLFIGCAVEPGPAYVRDGREYGVTREAFRNKWWNYYERGVSYADGKYYAEAMSDFREAVRIRAKDQRMARTYGMHFIDFFPHREIGVIHYETGDLKAAEKELGLSISQFPSAKARFYLDLVRKGLIEAGKGAVGPPILELEPGDTEIWTKADPVIVSGFARDDNYISRVTVGGKPVFQEGSQKKISFREKLTLSQGRHLVEVRARNLSGKAAWKKIEIRVDRQGPVMTVVGSQTSEKTGRIRVRLSVHDMAGISGFSCGERGFSVPEPNKTEHEFSFHIPVDGEKDIRARDRLGNTTTARLSGPSLLASATSFWLASAGSDDTGKALAASLFGNRDERPPVIMLRGWRGNQAVYMKSIYLEGEVRDDVGVAQIFVNETSLPLRREGRFVFFSHMVELAEGANGIAIRARDRNGNESVHRVTVARKIPKALELSERLSVSVFPFEFGGNASGISDAYQDFLTHALVGRNRFRVVERGRLDIVLKELELSRTKLVDRETALEVGKLVAARSVMIGRIVRTRTGIEIIGRMVDTETSEILSAVDVYGEFGEMSALKPLARGMAAKFHQDFPLAIGTVVRRKRGAIFTDLGNDVIKVHRRVVLFRETPVTHPETGIVLGSDNEITGHARITQVMTDLSKARLVGGDDTAVRSLDRVVAE